MYDPLIEANLRDKEFKLRQKSALSRISVPEIYHAEIRRLLMLGESKKLLCKIFGCNYSDLKRIKNL